MRRDPANIHGMCEDYRAGGVDRSRSTTRPISSKKIACPVLALWGAKAPMGRLYDVLSIWRERGEHRDRPSLPAGHNLQEDAPGGDAGRDSRLPRLTPVMYRGLTPFWVWPDWVCRNDVPATVSRFLIREGSGAPAVR